MSRHTTRNIPTEIGQLSSPDLTTAAQVLEAQTRKLLVQLRAGEYTSATSRAMAMVTVDRLLNVANVLREADSQIGR